MKRLTILVAFSLLMSMCTFVSYATEYGDSELGIEVYFDDEEWLVITRDNQDIDLSEYGVSSEYVEQLFEENDTLYLDAVRLEDNTDLLLRVYDSDGLPDSLSMSDDELSEAAASMASETGSDTYGTITLGGQKYCYVYYYDKPTGYYVYEFVTIVGGKIYNFTAENTEELWRPDLAAIKNVLKNDVSYYSTNSSNSENAEKEGAVNNGNPFNWGKIIGAGVMGGFLALVGLLFSKSKGRRKDGENTDSEDNKVNVPEAEKKPADTIDAERYNNKSNSSNDDGFRADDQIDSKDTKTDERSIAKTNVESKGSIPIDDLRQLKTLNEEGVITDEEFEMKKRQLLNL